MCVVCPSARGLRSFQRSSPKSPELLPGEILPPSFSVPSREIHTMFISYYGPWRNPVTNLILFYATPLELICV